ncbi:MAG: PH domain-containing protein [Candidatus Methanomethylophilaceae archaeon]|nr:PH domain-containing protein [Candidatus Methanomethylophilaceae archaeon]MBR4203716.1 PH domain-containing protein [Candidatus Methanomethylophilaceae archaeon]
MGIDFDTDINIDLTQINSTDVNKNIYALLIEGEQFVDGYKTVRDQLIFTNKRMISVDVKGITGKKQFFTSMPYKMVQYFTIQTSGFAEIISDSEMDLMFSNGHRAHFEFKGRSKILEIGKMISKYCLEID